MVGNLSWPPTPGVEYWDGYVLGAAEATSDTGNEPVAYAYVFLRRFTHTDNGDEIVLSETWGEAWGSAVSLQHDRTLDGASLTATLDTVTCLTDSDDCTPGTGTVSLTWTGDGEIIRGGGEHQGQHALLHHDSQSPRG